MSRNGDINGEDEVLWDYVTADVTPLPGRKKPKSSPPAAGPVRSSAAPPLNTRIKTAPKPSAPQARDIDRRTEQKLSRGQMEIDAVIDLHGHGQAKAQESLLRFVQEAYRRDYRCILVITGKGKQGGGVLRARLPEWVDEPPLRDIVLRSVSARQAHGGHGAFYLLLRRRRT